MESAVRKPLRLWPGVIAAVLLCLLWTVLPIVEPDAILYSAIGSLISAFAIILWWLLLSRARWFERIAAVALIILSLYATWPLLHTSIRTAMNGRMFPIYAIVVVTPALVAWAVVTRNFSDRIRRASMVATILLCCGAFTSMRTDGIRNYSSELTWRWTATPEERLLAQRGNDLEIPSSAPAAVDATKAAERTPPAPAKTFMPETSAPRKEADWPGFRGRDRDGVIRGVHIETDWSNSPPVQLWRRAIGPGWSSIAVAGSLLYTQEQRGHDEVVSCYRLTTGEPVWQHRDAVRFWESNAGAGPRATPTVSDGRVYALGATGRLNVLDARTGRLIWSHDLATDADRNVPTWGFAGSPLIDGDQVIVAAAGTLVAYDRETGKQRWSGPSYGGSYSSPHRATIDGVAQILLLGGPGAISVAPADGTVLWEHHWEPGAMVQPAFTADGNVLINAAAGTGGLGIRRLAVARGSAGWTVEERWTSTALKPYFNDFVVHNGHAFGFDGSILACVDLADGKRMWKGGRYGNGQLVLLADQDLLLVLSDDGELALVRAATDQFKELARFRAIEGKTWNHPALAGDVLLVRNGEEMAAFRLPLAER